MNDIYAPAKAVFGSAGVPHILGLSASLVMKSNLSSMRYVFSVSYRSKTN